MLKALKDMRHLFGTLLARPYDPDGDGEGTWHLYENGNKALWHAPVIEDPTERCTSEICLGGREWIGCKKRVDHKGIHRNCESYAWAEGDERA